jgi:hypothetical protein
MGLNKRRGVGTGPAAVLAKCGAWSCTRSPRLLPPRDNAGSGPWPDLTQAEMVLADATDAQIFGLFLESSIYLRVMKI